MKRSRAWNAALNLGTAGVVAAALGLVARDRVWPAWRDRSRVDPGDRLPATLAFENPTSGDTLRIQTGRPVVLLVFRSTCAACERNLPAWRALARRVGDAAELLAVPMEDAAPGLAYARAHLPSAVPALPLRPDDFIRDLRLQAVPTTLLVDTERRLRLRLAGRLAPSDLDRLAALVPGSADSTLRPRGPAHPRTGGGR
ncbi:MAG: TlpA family protein disulfide reductase [Gemmatimonadota bacterium]